jgi:pilin isopeptide linkage protein
MKFAKTKKHIVSLGMAILMIIALLPFQAFAAENSSNNSVSRLFQVKLQIEGDKPSEDVPFTFILEGESDAPLPADTSAVIYGEGEADFDEIVYTTPGTYKYTIHQRDGGLDNYTYDETIYTITVKVRYSSGELLATYTAANSRDAGVKEPELLFINTYEEPDDSKDESSKPNDESSKPNDESSNDESSNTEESKDESSSNEESSKIEESSSVPTNDKEESKPTNSSNSENSDTSSSTPKTGDESNYLIWLMLSCAILSFIVGCVIYLSVVRRQGKD